MYWVSGIETVIDRFTTSSRLPIIARLENSCTLGLVDTINLIDTVPTMVIVQIRIDIDSRLYILTQSHRYCAWGIKVYRHFVCPELLLLYRPWPVTDDRLICASCEFLYVCIVHTNSWKNRKESVNKQKTKRNKLDPWRRDSQSYVPCKRPGESWPSVNQTFNSRSTIKSPPNNEKPFCILV